MSNTTTFNIEIEEGTETSKVFNYVYPGTGLPKNATGCSVEIIFKFDNLPNAIIYDSIQTSLIDIDGPNGVISLTIPWFSTFNKDTGPGTYTLTLTDTS